MELQVHNKKRNENRYEDDYMRDNAMRVLPYVIVAYIIMIGGLIRVLLF